MLTTGQSFNVVTQQDSNLMIGHSTTMKAIAVVTMIFLPATTIAVGFQLPGFISVAVSDRAEKSVCITWLTFSSTDYIWLLVLQHRLGKQENCSHFGFLDILVRDWAGDGVSLASVWVVVMAQPVEYLDAPVPFLFETGEALLVNQILFLIFNYEMICDMIL